ncbi:hypothetical protein [Croceiramulus getboli]|nr:hypothetical protein P8624_14020 [Flavobacteriaceae bacterium YJPT1-3]
MAETNFQFSFHPNKNYLKAALFFFLCWISSVGPLRSLLNDEGAITPFVLGVLPSFFAGVALVLWMIYATRCSRWKAFGYALGLLILAEIAQLFMDNQTADIYDALAGIPGALLGVGLSKWIASTKKNI